MSQTYNLSPGVTVIVDNGKYISNPSNLSRSGSYSNSHNTPHSSPSGIYNGIGFGFGSYQNCPNTQNLPNTPNNSTSTTCYATFDNKCPFGPGTSGPFVQK